jgi:hypothetical protein
MSADSYLSNILVREAVDNGPLSPARAVQATLQSLLNEWGGLMLRNVHPSGSFAKGTAVRGGTDIDLFVSISHECPDTLGDIYRKLFQRLQEKGYTPKQQNVSINIRVGSFDVDLVPAKHQGGNGEYHSLYRRRADTWTQTNVANHISTVANSGRTREIGIVKIWRNQKQLDFPSFYLELTVLAALSGACGGLAENVWKAFEYLQDNFGTARVVDPTNTNNIVSDDLSATERARIVSAARLARQATDWNQIVI